MWWGPKKWLDEPCRCLPSDNHAHRLLAWWPRGSNIYVGHHHVRLVMNRHFHGPEHGLCLESFMIMKKDQIRIHENLNLVQSMAARIVDGMLVVRIEHHIMPAGADMSPEDFRREVNEAVFRVCEHRQTHLLVCSLWRVIPEIEVQEATAMFSPCRDAPGFCDACLTDFVTTVEFGLERISSEWSISIVSYHLLGRGRTPRDDGPNGFFYDRSSKACGRDLSKYAPGSVRQMWFDVDSG